MYRPPTVYVSGPISGIVGNNRLAFANAVTAIKARWPDAKVCDPSALGTDIRHERHCQYSGPCECCDEYFASDASVDYRSTIIRDLRILADTDILWLMPGWQQSLGCLIEVCYFFTRFRPSCIFEADIAHVSWDGRAHVIVFPSCDDTHGVRPDHLIRPAWERAHEIWLPPGAETIAQQDALNAAPTDLDHE